MSTPVYEKAIENATWIGGEVKTTPEEDKSKKAHAVNVPMNLDALKTLLTKGWTVISTQDLVDGARHYRLELVSICQYRWIPTERPNNHDVCGACMAIASNWITEDGS